MSLVLIDIIAPVASSAFAAGITWLVARRKNEAQLRKLEVEADLLELKGVQQVVDFWQNMSHNLTTEMTKVRTELLAMTRENHSLNEKMTGLAKENHELKDMVSSLTVQLTEFKKLIDKTNIN